MKVLMRTMIVTTFAIFAFSNAAHAGILLEPYVGYVSGDMKPGTAKFTGSELGARVGYSILGFGFGAEYEGGTLTDDTTPKNEFTLGDIGVFVAYKFPVLFRVYATYVPSSEIKGKQSGASYTLTSGTSTKIGFGYTGLPFININLEYVSSEYEKMKALGVTSTLTSKATTSGYALSISAPFDLL